MEEKKKILVIGSHAAAYTVLQLLSKRGDLQLFAAPGSDAISEFATVVDIRENNTKELLEFTFENDICLTIVASEHGKNNICEIFQQNNQLIFGPESAAASICDSKVKGKKFMYQNHIPCPDFAVFDKQNFAYSYLEKCSYPVVLKTEYHRRHGVEICNNISSAKKFVDNQFALGEKRILIENYIWGHEFSFYVITDGYQAIPIGCVATYKYELEGNGGVMSSGMGAFSDSSKISMEIKEKIMQQVINPALSNLAESGRAYVGILGVDLVIDDKDNIFAIEFNKFLKSPDAQVILELLDEDIYDLFRACAIGSFTDDYETVKIKDENAISCVLCSGEQSSVINGLEDLDDSTVISHCNTKKVGDNFTTNGGRAIVVTRKSRILSKAVRDLYEEVDVISFNGKKYRKDIGTVL